MDIPASEHEQARLRVLQKLQILDTPPERHYDELTHLAATCCDAPIALVTLIDEDRQWFKAKVGVDVDATPRDWAICDHAIRQDQTFVVQDASQDPRFRDSPLVTGAPQFRSYAGAQLKTEGFNLGTLCVVGCEPRTLSDNQRSRLETLRDAVITELERRKLERENRALNKRKLSVCAWCEQVQANENGKPRWVSPMRFLLRKYQVTHSICPECHAHIEQDL